MHTRKERRATASEGARRKSERRQDERLEALSPARGEPETQFCCYLQCFRDPWSLSGLIWAMRGQESSAQGSEIKLQMHRAQARALPGGESIAQGSKKSSVILTRFNFDCPAQHLAALKRSRLHAVSSRDEFTAICSTFSTLRGRLGPFWSKMGFSPPRRARSSTPSRREARFRPQGAKTEKRGVRSIRKFRAAKAQNERFA